jgi:hypothetical protein
LDNDGKLNSNEKKAAQESIDNGFEQQFLFGLERAGLNADQRSSSGQFKHIRVI